MKIIQTQLRLPADLHKQVVEISRADDRSANNYYVKAIRNQVTRDQGIANRRKK